MIAPRAVVLLALLLPSVAAQQPPSPWKRVEGTKLPDAIRLWKLERDGDAPLRAWVVIADLKAPGIQTRPLISAHEKGKEALSSLAKTAKARVAVNASYFNMRSRPCRVVGWLVADGREIAEPTSFHGAAKDRRPLARSAVWWPRTGLPRLGWVRRDGKALWRHAAPELEKNGARKKLALPLHALGAGPMLLVGGKTRITRKPEQLFAKRDDRHPRTALGLRGSKLLLLVADGRSKESRGLTLAELAALLKSLGARDAMNLDGGGSSTLVVDGVLMNRPCGGSWQRPVPTGIGVFAR